MARKTHYKVPNIVLEEPSKAEDIERVDTIKTLDDIATLQPGKNAQLAAKKIREKYKKMREAKNRKNKFKLPGEIVKIETIETPQGEVKVPLLIQKPKVSRVKTAKKITKKYDQIRREKVKKLARVKKEEIIEKEPEKNYTKSAGITANKITDKYKKIRQKRKIDTDKEIRDVVSKKKAQIAAKKYII